MKHLLALILILTFVPAVEAATIQTVYTIEIKGNYRLPARSTAKEGKVAQSEAKHPSPIPSPVAQTKWDEFMDIAPRLAKQYDIPLSVMVGQAALESARGTSYRAIYQNNFFGLGAYHDGAVGFSYDTVEDCIRYYAELISTEPRYAEAYRLRDNPTAMLRAIKKAGYAEDPHYVAKVTSMPEFRTLKINQ